MWGLWTRHEITDPSSSGDATKDRDERETFPSGDCVWRTDAWGSDVMSRVEPFFHQVIWAGGRDPLDRHTSSERTPAEKLLFGAIMVTSSGFTAIVCQKCMCVWWHHQTHRERERKNKNKSHEWKERKKKLGARGLHTLTSYSKKKKKRKNSSTGNREQEMEKMASECLPRDVFPDTV